MKKPGKAPAEFSSVDPHRRSPHTVVPRCCFRKSRKSAQWRLWKKLLESANAGVTSGGNAISPHCAADEELRFYITGGPAEPDERARILEHLSRCKKCRQRSIELYRELRTMQSAIGSFHPTIPFDSKKTGAPVGKWPGALRWLAAAMVVLTVAAGGLFLHHRQSDGIWIEPAAGLRSSEQENTRHFRLDQPADGARLQRGAEARFTWPAIPAVDYYFITIYDSIGDIMVEMRTDMPVFRLIPDVGFLPGERYFWQVKAGSMASHGSVSEIRSFTISR